MNRRQFLATASTVLAAVAAGCVGLPVKKEPPSLTPPLPPDASAKPLRVALLSDVHIQPADSGLAPGINSKLVQAVEDLQMLRPDLWVTNGDISDHGAASEHEAFKQIMSRVTTREQMLVTSGNHEFYDMETTDDISLQRFREAFGQQQPYSSRLFGGLHFIMIADEQWKTAPYNKDWCWITPAQLRWFEQRLAAHQSTPTVVFMHQPLNETVAGSLGANSFGGTNAAKELEAIRKKSPQIILWFSGHTHRRLEAEGQTVKKGQTTFMALGSTIYQIMPAERPGERSKRSFEASQSRLIEIYPDKIIVRACDHAARRWMQELDVTVART